MTPLLLLALLSSPRPAAAAERASATEAGDVASRVAQARLFVKKGWYRDAEAELALARELPGGATSFDLHWLWANVAWELLQAEEAAQMAHIAAGLAPDAARRADAEQMANLAGQGMGLLIVSAPHDGMRSRLILELPAVIFDPSLKLYAERMASRLREKTPLPQRICLPPGAYSINGEAVTLTAGQTTELALPAKAIGSRGQAALQVARIEVAGGVALLHSAELTARPVVPTLELALTEPAGPLLLGVLGDLGRSGGLAPNGQEADPALQWSAGLRVGGDLPNRSPLAIRPSVLLRLGTQAGLPVACEGESCTLDESDPTAVLRVGQLLAAGGELSIDYRKPGHATALGSGVKVAVDHASGRVTDVTDRETVTWNATGVRVLANLTIAF